MGPAGIPRTRPRHVSEAVHGLRRSLGSTQLSMLAIGGAIGTGLFLGSGFAISIAGPAVLVSYAIGGLVTFLLMRALAEMTMEHPSVGAFGWFAARYVGPLAGFLVRFAYWSANVLAVGTEVTAIAIYMRLWLPEISGTVWILGFSAALVAVNLASVRVFGAVELVFSFCKIAAIAIFLVLGAWFLWATPHGPGVGFSNYVDRGGFWPHGMGGMWVGVIVSIFSYLGIEVIAVAAGEAANPAHAIRRALRATLLRLLLFYLATLTLMLAIVPWDRASSGVSPFVTVMAATGIPGAAAIINAVILIAALSAMNSQIYSATRMLLSLSEAGFAPKSLAFIDRRGVPRRALLASSVGIAFAAVVYVLKPHTAFAIMFAISMFGAMFTWGMIFLTHVRFRLSHRRPAMGSFASAFGLLMMTSLLATTPFTEAFRPTLAYGLPFILGLTAVHVASTRRRKEVSPRS